MEKTLGAVHYSASSRAPARTYDKIFPGFSQLGFLEGMPIKMWSLPKTAVSTISSLSC